MRLEPGLGRIAICVGASLFLVACEPCSYFAIGVSRIDIENGPYVVNALGQYAHEFARQAEHIGRQIEWAVSSDYTTRCSTLTYDGTPDVFEVGRVIQYEDRCADGVLTESWTATLTTQPDGSAPSLEGFRADVIYYRLRTPAGRSPSEVSGTFTYERWCDELCITTRDTISGVELSNFSTKYESTFTLRDFSFSRSYKYAQLSYDKTEEHHYSGALTYVDGPSGKALDFDYASGTTLVESATRSFGADYHDATAIDADGATASVACDEGALCIRYPQENDVTVTIDLDPSDGVVDRVQSTTLSKLLEEDVPYTGDNTCHIPCLSPAPPPCDVDADCDDGNACTIDACHSSGNCLRWERTCDDGDPCTIDSCDPAVGCTFSPCDDGNACTVNVCDPAVGCSTTPLSCDDGDPCTVDSCDPAVGCTHTACDDGNACTVDSCDPAVGCTTTPLSCDDRDACTVDSCDPSTGCVFDALALFGDPCSDGADCCSRLCQRGVCRGQ